MIVQIPRAVKGHQGRDRGPPHPCRDLVLGPHQVAGAVCVDGGTHEDVILIQKTRVMGSASRVGVSLGTKIKHSRPNGDFFTPLLTFSSVTHACESRHWLHQLKVPRRALLAVVPAHHPLGPQHNVREDKDVILGLYVGRVLDRAGQVQRGRGNVPGVATQVREA